MGNTDEWPWSRWMTLEMASTHPDSSGCSHRWSCRFQIRICMSQDLRLYLRNFFGVWGWLPVLCCLPGVDTKLWQHHSSSSFRANKIITVISSYGSWCLISQVIVLSRFSWIYCNWRKVQSGGNLFVPCLMWRHIHGQTNDQFRM